MSEKMPAAVVFDLDGTLVDSVPDLQASLNWMLGNMGRRKLVRDEVILMVGDGIAKLVERALAASGGELDQTGFEEQLAAFQAYYADHAVEHTTLFPGVRAALEELAGRGVRLGVCTNKPEAPARTVLAQMGIAEFFSSVAGGDTVPKVRKPDPGHLGYVLNDLAVDVSAAVMVGDNHNDVGVAQNLGVPVVAVTFGYPHGPVEELGADAMIDHFDDLVPVLAGLA